MRRLLMILTPCVALLLNGCASQSSSLTPANNVFEFATQSAPQGNAIPQDVLKRAAYTTLRRGYTHFTIEAANSTKSNLSLSPAIGIGVGRHSSAFGIGGISDSGLGIGIGGIGHGGGAGIGIGAGTPITSSPRYRWKAVMYKASGTQIEAPRGLRLYNAAALAK